MLLLARREPIVSPKIQKILLRISSKNPQLYSYVINSHWKLRIQPKQWAARQETLALAVNLKGIEGAMHSWPSLPTWKWLIATSRFLTMVAGWGQRSTARNERPGTTVAEAEGATALEPLTWLTWVASIIAVRTSLPDLKTWGRCRKLPIILELFPVPVAAYYSQNYSSIIGTCLLFAVGTNWSKPHTSRTALQDMCVCLSVCLRPYTINFKCAFKYFPKIEHT